MNTRKNSRNGLGAGPWMSVLLPCIMAMVDLFLEGLKKKAIGLAR